MTSAVVVVDMLNTYDHEDADPLLESVREALPAMSRLVARARAEDVPVVYVNDNYGDWSAGRPELVDRALAGRGADVVEPIVPPPDVGFVVKARHSIFFQTQLDYLLRDHEIDRVVLVGQVTEQCILYSALDAYVRRFSVAIPRDAVAAIDHELGAAALQMMERNMRADVEAAADCAL
ncbi:MAG TPA: isochorismatase family cysteine hydrolase [Solirubrobacteraceae bacterium]|jgi:nicotinamidase-related amidase|nr:isochorismatase family cysteine hydrolase [Solirubrobacteraceae bacterium]